MTPDFSEVDPELDDIMDDADDTYWRPDPYQDSGIYIGLNRHLDDEEFASIYPECGPDSFEELDFDD